MPSLRRLVLLGCLLVAICGATAGGATADTTTMPGHLDAPRRGPTLPVSPLRARAAALGVVFAARARRHTAHPHRKTARHHRRKHRRRRRGSHRHRTPATPAVSKREPQPIDAPASAGGPDWCGQPLQGDDVAHRVFTESTIKLAYAYMKGQPNRFAYWAPILQANAGVIMQFVATQSDGQKTVRFDMGTACGPQYLDIQLIPLRGHPSDYLDDSGDPTVDPGTQLNREIARAVRGEGGHNYLVFVDGLNQVSPGDPPWAWGMTDVLEQDARPGPENRNNAPGRIAAIFGPDSPTPEQGPLGFDSTMFLHELMHTIGAVQSGAPHATAGGHCWDGGDVMCYDDGTAGGSNFSYDYCDQVGGEIYQPLDCNKDDYFSPAPAAGSYLASHWNTYDSVFLAPCADARVAAACQQ